MKDRFFEVHPHCGYLNTDITITNISEREIVIYGPAECSTGQTGESQRPGFSLEIGESKKVRLSAGKHNFTYYAADIIHFDNFQCEEVNIEDAIKLGGGKPIDAYSSDVSPWSLVKMTDRMYFYNIETGTEKVELNFVPDKVDFLSKDYLLLNSRGSGYSVYSLDTFEPEVEFDAAPLFSNDACLVYIRDNNDSINSLGLPPIQIGIVNFSGKDHVVNCDKYAINDENEELYIYAFGKIKTLSLKSLEVTHEITPTSPVVYLIPSGGFICQQVKSYGTFLYMHDFEGKNIGQLFNDSKIVSVNGVHLYDEKIDQTIKEELKRVVSLISPELQKFLSVYSESNHINDFVTVKDSIYYKIREEKFDSKRYVSNEYLHRFSGKHTFAVDNGTKIKVVGGLLVYYNNKYITVIDESNTHYKYEGHLIESAKSGYLDVEVDGIKSLRKLSGEVIVSDNFVTFFKCSGYPVKTVNLVKYDFVAIPDKDGTYSILSLTRPGYALTNAKFIKVIKDYLIFTSNDVKYMVSANGNFSKLPNEIIIDEILDISKHGKYLIIGRKNGKGRIVSIGTCKYETENHYVIKDILTNIFDKSFYRDVLFAKDGDEIAYSDGYGMYHMKNLQTGEICDFHSGKYVRHLNGYRTMIEYDDLSQPRVVDPVTGNYVEGHSMNDITFVSPDENFVIEKPSEVAHHHFCSIEYINKFTYEKIDEDTYNKLIEELDYPGFYDIPQSINENRKKKFKEYACQLVDIVNDRLKSTILKNVKLTSNDILRYALNNLNGSLSDNKIFNAIEMFSKLTASFSKLIIETNEYLIVRNKQSGNFCKVNLGRKLWFLNYISFSYDSRYIAIVGRYPDNIPDETGYNSGGLLLLYDLVDDRVVKKSTNSNAVWTVAFTKDGSFAYYDSTPDTFMICDNFNESFSIFNRNFLTFSPSGRYMALSNQGYIRRDAAVFGQDWGHQPNTNVYLRKTSDPNKEIAHFNDHGSGIVGTGSKTVSMVAFSPDDKKIMSVSDDGVVVIRNLHFEQ